MKRQRKKYESPRKAWDKTRIEKEQNIVKDFGVRRKKEIWRMESLLRKYRRMARNLAAKKDKETEKMLIKKLVKAGLLEETASLDDVLGLTLENVLERRLQTILFRKGLANTPNQARQFIVHGHVSIDDKKISYPSYLVAREEEGRIKVDMEPVKKVEK